MVSDYNFKFDIYGHESQQLSIIMLREERFMPKKNRSLPEHICSLQLHIKWIGWNRNTKYTLEEFSCGVSELKPKTKLDSWLSPLRRFQDIDADKHKALLNVETDSITFWNSAWPEGHDVDDKKIKVKSSNIYQMLKYQRTQVRQVFFYHLRLSYSAF